MAGSKKIGVLTFHRCINYGSYWQARCLVEGLRAMGHNAVLLDHDSARVNRQEWRCALHPQLPARSSLSDSALHGRKTRRFLEALESLPLSERFELDEPRSAEKCDIVVVGSDEVWNLSHPWYGGHPTFYGRGIEANRLVSYAASFGNQRAADGMDPFWVETLSAFEKISVRDSNSATIVRDALGQEPELVLDPCLQFPPTITQCEDAHAVKSYVGVYGHTFPPWFANAVRRCAREAGHRLVSIGYRNDWADEQLIDAGPYRFSQFMAAAAAVATNFFHGCVFSLLNAKPFVCVSSQYRANKISDLMRLVSAERHLVSEGCAQQSMSELLAYPLEEHIHRQVAQMRLRSQAYLEKAVA